MPEDISTTVVLQRASHPARRREGSGAAPPHPSTRQQVPCSRAEGHGTRRTWAHREQGQRPPAGKCADDWRARPRSSPARERNRTTTGLAAVAPSVKTWGDRRGRPALGSGPDGAEAELGAAESAVGVDCEGEGEVDVAGEIGQAMAHAKADGVDEGGVVELQFQMAAIVSVCADDAAADGGAKEGEDGLGIAGAEGAEGGDGLAK